MIFFLYLILSATLLTGTSPVEAKITDVVQQALLTLTNLCPEGQVKTEEGGCSCPSEKPYRDEQGKCHAVDRDCSEENKIHTKSLGDICRCPEGSVFSGDMDPLFGDGECCPNSTPYWDGQKCIVSCEEEGRKQGEEWQKDSKGQCCAVSDIREEVCCPKEQQYEENGRQLCCQGHIDKGHCCDYDRVWSEYTSKGITTGHCCPEGAEWNGKTCGDCPEEGVRIKGICCKNNLAYDSDTGDYVLAQPSACGCPDGGEEKNRRCCKGNKAYSCTYVGEEFDQFGNNITGLENCGYYYNAEECGCPLDKKWDKDKKKCVCIEGVPDSEGKCCKNGASRDENGYQKCCEEGERTQTTGKKDANGWPVQVCCPEESTGVDSEGKCCKKGEWSRGTGKKDVDGYEVRVCCPEKSNGVDSNGTCCKNGASRDENGYQKCCKEGESPQLIGKKNGAGAKMAICCPKGSKGVDSNGTCCKNGASRDENGYQKCCEEGEVWSLTNKKTAEGLFVLFCCPKGFSYSQKEERCCEILDSRGGCCPNNQIMIDSGDKKICCENGISRDENGHQKCCEKGKKSVYTGRKTTDGIMDVTVCCSEDVTGADSAGNCCKNDYVRAANGLQKCCEKGEHMVWTNEKSADLYDLVEVCCPEGKNYWSDKESRCCEVLDADGKCTCSKGEEPVSAKNGEQHCCPAGSVWLDPPTS